MSVLNMSPRGLAYSRISEDCWKPNIIDFEKVRELFDRYVDNEGQCAPIPEIINDTIELASAVFLRGEFYVVPAIDNADYMSEMVEDTKAFIKGEPRKLSSRMWNTMIAHVDEDEVKNILRNPFNRKVIPLRLTDKDIAAWARRENGIYDMLCTMHILFN